MLKTISLFTGAGGLDLGLHAAGFSTVAAVEQDVLSCETLRHNHPEWNPQNAPIENVYQDLLEISEVREGDTTLLVGGPPCQPFSKCGYWKTGDSKRMKDPRANTITMFLEVVRRARPKVVLFENVKGIIYKGKEEALTYVLKSFQNLGYQVSYEVLQAAEYGVPQLRERFFLIAHRGGAAFDFGALEPYRSTRNAFDAIGDLENEEHHEDLGVRGKNADLLRSVPPGHNYLWFTERGATWNPKVWARVVGPDPQKDALFGWRRRYWNFLLKLSRFKPSWTIAAQPGPAVGPFHWSSRQLSTNELLRLQTFPREFTFPESISRRERRRQIGNAVPSLLAEILGREIQRQLLEGGRHRCQEGPFSPTLELPKRDLPYEIDEWEKIPPVQDRDRKRLAARHTKPEQRHDAHAGTGKGYSKARS